MHPLSSGLRRFKSWKTPFLVKLFVHYTDHVRFGSITYHNQQLDLDLLREVIIDSASLNLLMLMLLLLSMEFNDHRWKDYLVELIQEITRK
ncbi:MAG: hypothetical protein ACTSP4_01660 [Candidatus Hodarchaeales archaeon]